MFAFIRLRFDWHVYSMYSNVNFMKISFLKSCHTRLKTASWFMQRTQFFRFTQVFQNLMHRKPTLNYFFFWHLCYMDFCFQKFLVHFMYIYNACLLHFCKKFYKLLTCLLFLILNLVFFSAFWLSPPES